VDWKTRSGYSILGFKSTLCLFPTLPPCPPPPIHPTRTALHTRSWLEMTMAMSSFSGGALPTSCCKPRTPKESMVVVVAAKTVKLRRVVVILQSMIEEGVWSWGDAEICLWMCWVG